jgi:hypothetical protein
MRVTVSHRKTQQEVVSIVDRTADELFAGSPGTPIQIVDPQKSWNGSVMDFSFTGKMGFFSTQLKGKVEVLPELVAVEIDLPEFLKKFMPEEKVRTAVEGRMRKLLNG